MKLVTYADNTVPHAEERRLFYVALTRTKNRVYLVTPQNRPSRFVIELIKEFNLAHDKKLNLQLAERFTLKCPVCGLPLKYERNKNYGIDLYYDYTKKGCNNTQPIKYIPRQGAG